MDLYQEVQRRLEVARTNQAALEKQLAQIDMQKAQCDMLVLELEELVRIGNTSSPLPAQAAVGSSDGAEVPATTPSRKRPPAEASEPAAGRSALTSAIHDILKGNPRKLLRPEWLWQQAAAQGCETTVQPPHRAVRWVLYALSKQGVPVRRVGRGQWRYTG